MKCMRGWSITHVASLRKHVRAKNTPFCNPFKGGEFLKCNIRTNVRDSTECKPTHAMQGGWRHRTNATSGLGGGRRRQWR